VWTSDKLNADGSPQEYWNGKYMNTGPDAPQSAYVWVVDAVFTSGRVWNGMLHPKTGRIIKIGSVTLLR
jgi:hypothetical protein